MLYTKESTLCQMSMTKPHTDLGILQGVYINVSNSCNSAVRYTFDKLIPKLTQYTSYEVGNPRKVVPTIETTSHEK
jgi:hypothetical protein